MATAEAQTSGWARRAAIALAAGWRGPRRIVLADLDLTNPTLHEEAGVPNEEGVVDLIDYGVSLDRVIRPADGFDVLPAGLFALDPGSVLRHEAWVRVLTEVAARRATLLMLVPEHADGCAAVAHRAGAVIVLAEGDEGVALAQRLPHPFAVLAILTHAPAPVQTEAVPAGPDIEEERDVATAEPDTVAADSDAVLPGRDLVAAGPEAMPAGRDIVGAASDAAPTAHGVSTAGSDATSSEGDRVAAEGDAVAAESGAVAAEGDAVAAEDDAVAAEDDAVAAEGDAVAAEDDAGAEGDAVAAEGDAFPSSISAEDALIGKLPVPSPAPNAEFAAAADGAGDAPAGAPDPGPEPGHDAAAVPDHESSPLRSEPPSTLRGGRLSDSEFERIRLPTERESREALIGELRDRQRAARFGSPQATPAGQPGPAESGDSAALEAHVLAAGTNEPARAALLEARADAVNLETLTPSHRSPPIRAPRYRHAVIWTAGVVLLASLLGGAWHFLSGRLPRTAPVSATPEPAAAPVGEPPATENSLPFVVAIEAHRDLVTAADRVSDLREIEPQLAFHVEPLERDGVLFYHVMAGPVADSAVAMALRDTLISRGHKTGRTPTDVRATPMAYLIGEYASDTDAREQAEVLRRLDIPGYVLPAVAADGEPVFRLYVGGFSGEAEAGAVGQMLRAAGIRDTLVTRTGIMTFGALLSGRETLRIDSTATGSITP